LGKAILFVIILAIVWAFISPYYNHLLVKIGNGIAPAPITLDLQQDNINFYHYYPDGTFDRAYIPSLGIQFGLILVIALICATPGLTLKKRLKFIAIAAIILFVVHVIIIWITSVLLLKRIILGNNFFFNLLVPVGCNLFPVIIWGVMSLKYWFPQKLAEQPASTKKKRDKKRRGRSR
jgi:hypothetical protein